MAAGFIQVPNDYYDRHAAEPDRLAAFLWVARTRDYATGHPSVSVRGLARKFGWSLGKSFRAWHEIVEHLVNARGTPVEHQRNGESAIDAAPLESVGTSVEHARNGRGTEAELFQEARSKKQEEGTTTTPPSGGNGAGNQTYSSAFLEFWTLYPRKQGKGAAWKVWKKAQPPLEDIRAALSWQTQSEQWAKDHGQFIPQPATYLNQRRWEDEPVQETQPQNRLTNEQIREYLR